MATFDPHSSYTTTVDLDGDIWIFQNGLFFDRYGNQFPSIPKSNNGYAPPTPTGDMSDFVASNILNDSTAGASLGTTQADVNNTVAQNLITLLGVAGHITVVPGPGAQQGTIDLDSNLALPGTTGGVAAAAGVVGERVSSSTLNTALTTVTPANAASLALTAGDWEIQGVCIYHDPAGSGTAPAGAVTFIACGISIVSATPPSDPFNTTDVRTATAPAVVPRLLSPPRQLLNSNTQTVYLVTQQSFAGSVSVDGYIWARRMR